MKNKTIYYCWFGGQPLSSEIVQYIQTWKNQFPDYKIVEINETNFSIAEYKYAQSAYEYQRYAFVSDCARIHYLNQYGGIYLDTDVEVIRNFAGLWNPKSKNLFSMEYFQWEITGVNTAVLMSDNDCRLWQDLLDYYRHNSFVNDTEPQTINSLLTHLLREQSGLLYKDIRQDLNYKGDAVQIVPSTLLMRQHNDAYAVHHLNGTWTSNLSFGKKCRRLIGMSVKKILGRDLFEKLWSKK